MGAWLGCRHNEAVSPDLEKYTMVPAVRMLAEFKNEPFTDFSVPTNQEAMKAALAKVKQQLGRSYPLIIGGERIETGDWITSTNPAAPDQVIGKFAKATREHAEHAMQAALTVFERGKKVSAKQRAELLFRAANIMRERKHELAAWMILEVGKNWAEADGDVAEAIDFCEYYGREMLKLSRPPALVPYPGEDNKLAYIPLGVGLVIPPWNFPLAILVGMTTASIVTGNTVVLKPASDSPAIASDFVALMDELKLPPGVINLVTGSGAVIGDRLR